jgi:proteasome lid subunit RPN8/RPN11
VVPWPIRTVVIPPPIRASIESHITTHHPDEAGGFLGCQRRGRRLRAARHVPIENESSIPKRRFETTVDERVPPPPRVFYHSHTSPESISGLTRIDKRSIPEPFALVIFAPRGEPLSYRGFKHGIFEWWELRVEAAATGKRLARL